MVGVPEIVQKPVAPGAAVDMVRPDGKPLTTHKDGAPPMFTGAIGEIG